MHVISLHVRQAHEVTLGDRHGHEQLLQRETYVRKYPTVRFALLCHNVMPFCDDFFIISYLELEPT